ncbi:MAG: NAD(P)-dependent oxidoreductase, partial [Muribaculaceae bacterium]|nr:NAD(P)-dependent oxidoreductase [Muribaculaceae bacterium]
MPGKTDYYDHHSLDITDSRDVEKVIAEGGYTHIVNAAAYTAVDRAEDEKSLCTAVNVDGVKNLANAAASTGARLVHISTDYVFDGIRGYAYGEADKPNPLSHYGASKRKGEMALLGLLPDSVIVRTGWLFSPFGKNFVKTIYRKSLNGDMLRVV